MGKKRQKVRWLSIEDNVDGRNPSRVTTESEEGDRMSLSPPVVVELSSSSSHVPPNRLMDKGVSLPYARRPVAPRFERKAAAEVLYESSSRSYRGRELSGDSSEELPMGFTKIRSKNLDVLFKRDYYSTKGGLNSEANTHSETSSLTQKEDEKEEEEVEELEVEEEVLEEEFEVVEEVEEQEEGETASKNNKESVSKSTTSKLNGSSSPFYPSSPGYVMPVHPYVTGRPNLFLYSPSSNTMIPCEEVVVPSMFPGSPSSPQNVYLAAFPMEGSHHPYMMTPSYPSPPYYSPQPVYSDAEPSSAESTLPHSPPELSAYNPAYWGDIHHHSQRGNYVHGYHYQPDPSYTQLEGISPQRTPEKMPVVPEVEDKKEDEEAAADSNALEGRRVPGLPPQPKKSQKKKRKKKNKNSSELVHRNSTSSEEGRTTTATTTTLHLLKEESTTASPGASSDSISFDESSKKSTESSSPPPSSLPLEQGDLVEPVKDDEDDKTIPERAKSPVKEEEEVPPISPLVEPVVELEKEESVEEQPPPCVEEKEEMVEVSVSELSSSSELLASNAKEVSSQEEVEEKPSNVVLVEEVENPPSPSNEVIEKVSESNPRMLYSSVVSQSMPKSPSHNINIKSSSKAAVATTTTSEAPLLTVPTTKAKEAPLHVSTSLENLRPAEEADSGEWLESSSRKKIKRQRQSKKSSKSSKYSSSPSSSVTRSVSLESPSQAKEEESNFSLPAEKVEEFSRSLESLPAAPTTKLEKDEEKVEEEISQDSSPTKSNELAEEKILSNSVASPSKKPLSKKKKNKQRGDSSATNSKVSNSTTTNSDTSKKQVLICDGAIDVSSSFSSLKRVSDIGCLRLHSQPLSKGSIGLDTLFISDVGLGIRNGPIMSGRPLRVGKYNPPDRAGEILSMKASLVSSTKENAQYMPLD